MKRDPGDSCLLDGMRMKGGTIMSIEKAKLIDMYRKMVRIRKFEDRVRTEFASGKIPGFVHLYSGEEATAVGACANLTNDDYITSTHRGHGHLIAKGGKTDRMMAELFGKKTGYNKGKGGSMHIADVELGILGANGIVGAGIPIAGGAALSSKMRKTNQVATCFLGDGATNTSRFHEGVNLAAIWNLPVVYIVENNLYAECTPLSDACKLADVANRAIAYSIPGVTVDGNDVLAVYEAVNEAVARARGGGGPTLVECKTYRRHGHFQGDPCNYQPKEEVEEWKKKDPIPKFRKKLVEMGIFTEQEADKVDQEINKEIDEAVRFAEESPFPAPQETLDDVYVEMVRSNEGDGIGSGSMREITYLQAIIEAYDEELARDPNVFIMGEDIGAAWGGSLGDVKGLQSKYGVERVRHTPVSETAILGGCIGAAATGMRPIAYMFFADFTGVAGDEFLNQLKMRYMFGGKARLPLTITCASGAGISGGAQHSKCLEGLYMCIPGIKIVSPSTPYDVKGLLKSAIREDNPVLLFYHKALMLGGMKGKIPEGEYTVPLGKADVKREGSDVTVVAIQLMVHRALAAAEKLQEKGISIEVIDPRTLVPLDKKTILDSVKKTGRLVVMTEEPITGSAAGEIAAVVASEGFDFLNAPIRRVCAPDTPIPFAPVLEKFWMPDEEDLIKAVTEIM